MASFVISPVETTSLPVVGGGLFPVRRVFCVGQNYADHAREMGGDPDRQPPFFFSKPADAITTNAKVAYPPQTARLDYEGELVVAIGKAGADIAVEQALDHVYGYGAGCDLTRRDLQAEAKKAGRPWDMAKGFDQSGVCAEIVPVAKSGHPSEGRISLSVNGQIKQDGNLNQMIWSIPEVISVLSRFVTLQPGDLIYTGTPAGVGPLNKGDAVDITVAGVGSLSFSIV